MATGAAAAATDDGRPTQQGRRQRIGRRTRHQFGPLRIGLDRAVERWLADRAGLTLDFEIGDALDKLLRLGLVRRDESGRRAAVPPEEALALLDVRWDRYYNYSVPEIGG